MRYGLWVRKSGLGNGNRNCLAFQFNSSMFALSTTKRLMQLEVDPTHSSCVTCFVGWSYEYDQSYRSIEIKICCEWFSWVSYLVRRDSCWRPDSSGHHCRSNDVWTTTTL